VAPGAPSVKLAEPPIPRTIDLAPLFSVVAERIANPDDGSYTNKLLAKGVGRIAQKVGEEGVETALAAVSQDDGALAGEIADLLYHVVVLMAARGIEPSEVGAKLESRRGKRRTE
jgi:phosphoribosyl-ATP pyrophosphohydrolase